MDTTPTPRTQSGPVSFSISLEPCFWRPSASHCSLEQTAEELWVFQYSLKELGISSRIEVLRMCRPLIQSSALRK